jgi:hypothetical protein
MHEEQTAENYNQEFHGNPHGPNRLGPRFRSPHRLAFADVGGSAALRALPEFPAVKALLEAMQAALMQRQSVRFELWLQGEEALSLARAVREGANSPYGATEPDAQLANSLSCEIHEMLAAYAVEAMKLLHIIADTERHRIKVSSDRLLPRTLKLFTVEHWGNYHTRLRPSSTSLSPPTLASSAPSWTSFLLPLLQAWDCTRSRWRR